MKTTMEAFKPVLTFLLIAWISLGYTTAMAQDVVNQERKVKSFSSLVVSSAFNIELSQGNTEKLVLEADEDIIDRIETTVRGGTLYIRLDGDFSSRLINPTMNILLSFTDLKEIELSGAVELEGQNRMKFDELEIDISGAAEIEMEIDADRLNFVTSGASKCNFSGEATELELNVTGASKFDSRELIVERAYVNISGASHAKIHVSEELEARVSGVASLKYKGDPSRVKEEVSGPSHISSMD